MVKKLIIAEKRDAGQTIAEVIKNVWGESFRSEKGYMESEHYIVSWCAGHLVSLSTPEEYSPDLKKWSLDTLPIIPEKWRYSVLEPTKNQYFILKSLMDRDDVTGLVNASDAGREGELIFRLVYNKANCKKPVKRLWASTTAEEDLKKALLSMKPSSDYDSLYFAAMCRSVQDWIIGINATRKYTCEYNQKITIGRVQTPTLAMVVKRDLAIEGFQKNYFYEISFTDSKGTTFVSEKFETKQEAQKALNDCSGKNMTIKKVKVDTKKLNPPMLYSTTELQKDAGKIFGFSPKETLDCMQSLYDKHLQSYPRTDAVVLSTAQETDFTTILNTVIQGYSYPLIVSPNIKRLINDTAITDHPAVILTKEFTIHKRDRCSDAEKNILDLVANRMVIASASPYIYESTVLIAECNGVLFRSTGKKTVDEGWKTYQKKYVKQQSERPLAPYSQGEVLNITDISVVEKETEPPARFTTSTLLDAMEKAGKKEMEKDVERVGIGTSATRADVIDKLEKTGYIRISDKKQTIVSTEKGRALIAAVPTQLKEVDLTVEWENKMLEIRLSDTAKAKALSNQLIEDTKTFIRELINTFQVNESLKETGESSNTNIPSVGACPVCGSPVLKSKDGNRWYCSGYKEGCNFYILKTSDKGIYPTLEKSKVALDDKKVSRLLEKRKTTKLKLVSKAGKSFEAYLVLSEYSPKKYGLSFEFVTSEKKKKK